jgi:membrane protease YdiL (CAAX protease family)
VFASCLATLSIAAGLSFHISKKIILIGLAGALVLCLPALVGQFGTATYLPYGNYLSWSIVVSCVALAEEAFLRGVLFNSIRVWGGSSGAILVGALAFCVLHIPLYGWRIVPLDFVVGIWLGVLRAKSDSWVTPGITHTIADLSAWWLI